MGAEKFMDIKCRAAGIAPDAVVIVATIRALKMHGGVAKADLSVPNVSALEKGFENLAVHIENISKSDFDEKLKGNGILILGENESIAGVSNFMEVTVGSLTAYKKN